MNTVQRLQKNQRISRARELTLKRHRAMTCRTYELKVDRSHLSAETLETLRRLFLEAKWFYNHVLAAGIFQADYKITQVQVKNRQDEFEERKLICLSSQMRQEIIDRGKDSIRSLSALKNAGRRIGSLKFTSMVRSIPLRQYGMTYRVHGDCVSVQNIRQPMRVRGIDQIPPGAELANATLEQREGDYFLHVTTYQKPLGLTPPEKAIGVDAGVRHQLTLSNGLRIDERVLVTEKAKRLHRELSKRKLSGKNWQKTSRRLNREYRRLTNQRADIRHKIVSRLISTYDTIAVQDDNIAGWQRIWGRCVATSVIGGIMSDLRTKPRTPAGVERYEPTTQRCNNCGALTKIGLKERTYLCGRCGLRMDRDLNAAINAWKAIPAERRESTPVDTKATTGLLGYFNGIPHVSARLVVEAGSQLLATEANGFDRR